MRSPCGQRDRSARALGMALRGAGLSPSHSAVARFAFRHAARSPLPVRARRPPRTSRGCAAMARPERVLRSFASALVREHRVSAKTISSSTARVAGPCSQFALASCNGQSTPPGNACRWGDLSLISQGETDMRGGSNEGRQGGSTTSIRWSVRHCEPYDRVVGARLARIGTVANLSRKHGPCKAIARPTHGKRSHCR
jgi:hypothetical protein